jgi:hypothetical protein
MMVRRRYLYWGVFFVAAGAVTLVAQADTVDREVVAQALRLWPVAVIALGVGVLLRGTRLGVPGGMLAAAMPGLLLGGLFVATPQWTRDCSDIMPGNTTTRQGTFDGAASVDLTLACGELSITTAQGDAWQLQAGNRAGADPTIGVSADRLSVASWQQKRPFGFIGGDAWRLSLPTANRLDLTAEINAGQGRFDLAGARLGDVRLAVNAGDARVDLSQATVEHLSISANAASASVRLPATGDFSADLSANAASIEVCAPGELGLRVRGDAVLGATTYRGLVRNGDVWESPGYSIAKFHADMTVSASVGSVDINPAGGCK